jgi:ethanolamine ammonia-lyase large subunit
MSAYRHRLGSELYSFADLRTLLAKASPPRSGDQLAGLAAENDRERAAAQMTLAEVPLKTFLNEPIIDYESDEVTRLIIDGHDAAAFASVSHLTVSDFRNWLLGYETGEATLSRLAPGLTPEMAAAVSKIMRVQDLIMVAKKCRVVTRFRNTLGLPGRLATRLQPNHPTDDRKGIAASILDGLLYGNGDAVIGVNPATDHPATLDRLLRMLDSIVSSYSIPTQFCVLAHVTSQLEALRRGNPIDLLFQSISGTEAGNRAFGITLSLLAEARQATLELRRGTLGDNGDVFRDWTGQRALR